MKLTVLSDNNTIIDRYFVGEPAVSYFIECDGKKVTGENRLHSVIGGFHLMNPHSRQLIKTVDYFGETKDVLLYPCHCTGFEACAAIHSRISVHETGSGAVFEWK